MDDYDEPAHGVIIADEPPSTTSERLSLQPQSSSLLLHQDCEPPFVPEQRILCKDNGTLYEAVVRQSKYGVAPNKKPNANLATTTSSLSQLQIQQGQQQKPQWSYLVHFLGWNTRYDKWVKHDDILPDIEEHRAKLRQQQLQQQQQQMQLADAVAPNLLSSSPESAMTAHASSLTTMAAKSSTKRKATEGSTQSKRQRRDGLVTGAGLTSTADYCELPFTLQTVLVEEWEHITRDNQNMAFFENQSRHALTDCWRPLRNVHHLPSPVTIRQVLQHFVKLHSTNSPPKSQMQQLQHQNRVAEAGASAKSEKELSDEEKQRQQQLMQQKRRQVKDFVQDLMALVEEALPVCLLYPQERPQWEIMRAQEPPLPSVCDVYGAEYLLRLLVRLPILMPTVKKHVGQLVAELIVMLQKNRNVCFKGNYREPLPEEWLESERKCVMLSQQKQQREKGNGHRISSAEASVNTKGAATPNV